jgi:hypothetical protein
MLSAEGFPEPNYGCGPLEFSCHGQETIARVTTAAMNGLGNFMTDMIVNAFKGSRMTDNGWSVADGQFWFWIAVMGLVVISVALFQMMPAMILGDIKRLGQIALSLAFCVPASVLAVWLMRQVSTIGNNITDMIMSSLQGEGLSAAIMRMFGFRIVGDTGSVNADGTFMKLTNGSSTAAGLGGLIVTFLIMCVMALAAMFLYISMAIRNFGLLALAATAPLGTMMIGQPKFAVWATRWSNLALGLILAEPLAAAIILLAVRLLGHGTDTGTLLVAVGAVFVASFGPVWAVKMVAFTGNEVGGAIQNRISITQIMNKGRSFMPRRAR